MRIGVTRPSMGSLSQPDNLIKAAREAERLGYDTLWVADRLLYRVQPRTKYPVTPDGSLPNFYKRVLDPVEPRTRAASVSVPAFSTFLFTIPSLSHAG